MQMKMPLARWLHRRISHMFLQATINNPYEIKLSTIVHDSGMKSYKTISERMRQLDKAFKELIKAKVLSRVEANQDKQKNKILDVLYSLYMSEEFVADAKKANKITNLRLGGEEEKKVAPEDIEELRKEIQKPLYGLTQTIINNCLANIVIREDYEKIVTALESVREYKEIEEKKGKKIGSLAALTKTAIREGWKPRNNEVIIETNVKAEEQNLVNIKKEIESQQDRRELQQDPSWLKVKEKIRKEYDEKDWKQWLAGIDIYSISQNQIVLCVESKFKRDWIIREFIDSKREEKSIKSLVQEIWPSITELKMVVS
jgi:hypothetical protein